MYKKELSPSSQPHTDSHGYGALATSLNVLNLAHKCDWTVHSIIVSDYIMMHSFNNRSVVYEALIKQKS